MDFSRIVPIVIALILILFIGSVFLNESKEPLKYKAVELSAEEMLEDSLAQIKSDSIVLENKVKRLGRELSSIKEFSASDYKEDATKVTLGVALLSTWAKMGREAEAGLDDRIVEIGEKMLKSLKAKQIKEFPKLRSNYAKVLKKALWADDIDVKITGKNKDKLMFVGRMFAANRNIQDFQNQLNQTLKDYRFKRASYKWYSGDTEYTYYDLNPVKDSEFVTY